MFILNQEENNFKNILMVYIIYFIYKYTHIIQIKYSVLHIL